MAGKYGKDAQHEGKFQSRKQAVAAGLNDAHQKGDKVPNKDGE